MAEIYIVTAGESYDNAFCVRAFLERSRADSFLEDIMRYQSTSKGRYLNGEEWEKKHPAGELYADKDEYEVIVVPLDDNANHKQGAQS